MAKKFRFIYPVKLIDKNGDARKILCDKISVRQDEFFAAKTAGLNPKMVLVCHPNEYRGEEIAEYQNEKFAIYRTFQTANNVMELYITKKIGVK